MMMLDYEIFLKVLKNFEQRKSNSSLNTWSWLTYGGLLEYSRFPKYCQVFF